MARRPSEDDDADREGLNEHQERRVLVTCRYVDRLLHNVEEILSASSSPFARHEASLSPAQLAAVGGSIAAIRARPVQRLTGGSDSGPAAGEIA